jgi:hypothetical protein
MSSGNNIDAILKGMAEAKSKTGKENLFVFFTYRR